MITVGSLFSGIGGLDLGLERAGMKVVWMCEKDAYAQKILRKHWPEVPLYDDVTQLKGCDLPCVDVICGGFPCQDISTAGKGDGLEGERSGLFYEMWRLVCEIRPKYVIMENVAALVIRGLDEVLRQIALGGYDAEWNIISAASVGACHRRDRIFIIAVRRQHAGTGGGWLSMSDSDTADPVCGGQLHGCDEIIVSREPFERREAGTVSVSCGPFTSRTANAAHAESAGRECGTAGMQDQQKEREEGEVGRSDTGTLSDPECEYSEGVCTDAGKGNNEWRKGRADKYGDHSNTEREDVENPVRIRNGGIKERGSRKDTQRRDPAGFGTPDRGNIGNGCDDGIFICRPGFSDYWSLKPRMGGVIDGVPGEMDGDGTEWVTWEHGTPRLTEDCPDRANRLRCLGNAVVPQVAEYIGRCVIDYHERTGGRA